MCFSDFCLIINPHGSYTTKFIDEDLSSQLDFAENFQSFAMFILEKAVENVCLKYKKRLALTKLPVEKLMDQIERTPDIIELKKLFAVKKSIISFQQTVESIIKVLKDLRKEYDTFLDMKIGVSAESDFEDILEYLIADIEDIAEKVQNLLEGMEEVAQFVSSHQDNVRNDLIGMTLIIEILGMTLGFGAFIGGVFGMNLTNSYEEDPHAFVIVNVILLTVMILLFAGFRIRMETMKRDTKNANSFTVLKNFFNCVDDLQFQDLPKLINRTDFTEAVKQITGMKKINEREVDFLFQMVDKNDDGLIDRETELNRKISGTGNFRTGVFGRMISGGAGKMRTGVVGRNMRRLLSTAGSSDSAGYSREDI